MEQPIKGPDPYTSRMDSDTAGIWINGITGEAFDALMAQHLPTVRPAYIGRKKLWNWMDVAILDYILSRGSTKSPAEKKTDGESLPEK